MLKTYFDDLSKHICFYLKDATKSLHIAVCWFSQREIFEIILEKVKNGLEVRLIIEYDSQNIKESGLNFQAFINSGGILLAYRQTALMHHKFVIIDNKTLLSGSFNWTYNSNAENLLVTDDPSAVQGFLIEWERLGNNAKRIHTVRQTEAKVFSAFPIFENTLFSLSLLRGMIAKGTCVWYYAIDKKSCAWQEIYQESKIVICGTGLFNLYWAIYQIWDEALFQEIIHDNESIHPAIVKKAKKFGLKIKVGDLVLAIENQQKLMGIGVVQSDPQKYLEGKFESKRSVQWLSNNESDLFELEKPISQGIGRYQGSSFLLLQRLFGR